MGAGWLRRWPHVRDGQFVKEIIVISERFQGLFWFLVFDLFQKISITQQQRYAGSLRWCRPAKPMS
jgi:hypothetical protein